MLITFREFEKKLTQTKNNLANHDMFGHFNKNFKQQN